MASSTLPSSQRRIVVENGSIKSPYLYAKIYSDPVQVWFDASILILPFRLFRQTRRLRSVSFESNSRLTRTEFEAFLRSSLRSILIPRTVEILCSGCFSSCKSLTSVTFESNSRLSGIESETFSLSSLQSIVIPRGVRFLDGSAFRNVKLSSLSIENENERFVIQKDCLIDIVDHKLIRNLSISSSVTIPCNIDFFCSSCFSWCKSLHSVTFESNSRLIRIESRAFSHSSHQSISEH
jgi:hypothetical protein